MADIETRGNLLARLAGRSEDTSVEAAVVESEAETKLLVISEAVAKCVEEEPRTAHQTGESVAALARSEIELFELLGRASVARSESRERLRRGFNELLEQINTRMPVLRELHTQQRKEEILEGLAEREEAQAPKRPKEPVRRLHRGASGTDVLAPLAIERPEYRNARALQTFEELLAGVEANPTRADGIINFLHARLGAEEVKVDPRFKSEARQFVRMLASIREKIMGRGGVSGMTDEQIKADAQQMRTHIAHIKKQAADVLQHIDDDRPIEALPKSNVFAELQNLN